MNTLFCVVWGLLISTAIIADEKFVKEKNQNLVVFVHGFEGGEKATWFNKTHNFFWPKEIHHDSLFVTTDGQAFDTISFGYQSNCFDIGKSVDKISNDLFLALQKINSQKKNGYKKIYLIGHSLGGIIIKKMLVSLPRSNNMLNAIHGYITLGTPHLGTEKLIHMLSKSCKSINMTELDASENSYLDKLNDDWRNKYSSFVKRNDFVFATGYELDPYLGLSKIVSKNSAIYSALSAKGLDGDHEEIAKLKGVFSRNYTWVRDLIISSFDSVSLIKDSQYVDIISSSYLGLSSKLDPEMYAKLLDAKKIENHLEAYKILTDAGIRLGDTRLLISNYLNTIRAFEVSESVLSNEEFGSNELQGTVKNLNLGAIQLNSLGWGPANAQGSAEIRESRHKLMEYNRLEKKK
jgi:hypothetical protein